MKLTNLDYAIQKAEQMDIFDHCDILGFVSNLSEIDPVHFAGGCYCKECLYSKSVEYEDNEGWITPIDEYWCNKHKDTMLLNGFCSEGRKDNTKNA